MCMALLSEIQTASRIPTSRVHTKPQHLWVSACRRGTCFTDACHAASASTPALSLALPKSTAGSNSINRPKPAGSRTGLPGRLAGRTAGPATGGGATAAGGAGGTVGLFDPAAPGALLVNHMQWQEGQGRLENGRTVAPVVSSYDCLSHNTRYLSSHAPALRRATCLVSNSTHLAW